MRRPIVLGAMSAAAPGAQASRKILTEPIGAVFLAGEATHETLWGTVDGAWESGERAADAALRKIGAIKDAEPVAPAPAQRAAGRAGTPRRERPSPYCEVDQLAQHAVEHRQAEDDGERDQGVADARGTAFRWRGRTRRAEADADRIDRADDQREQDRVRVIRPLTA